MCRKKLSEEDFVTKLLPDVAAMKAKVKDAKDPKAQEELSKMKKKLAAKCTEWKTQDSVSTPPLLFRSRGFSVLYCANASFEKQYWLVEFITLNVD